MLFYARQRHVQHNTAFEFEVRAGGLVKCIYARTNDGDSPLKE